MYITRISVEISRYYGTVHSLARATQHPCRLETAKSLKQAINPAYFILRLKV